MTWVLVVDPELVGDGQEQRVGLGNRLVFRKLLDENVGLGGVTAAKKWRAVLSLEESDRVVVLVAAAEIRRGLDRPSGERCCG